MVSYREDLKSLSRSLRGNMTDAEAKLWFYLRRRQIANVQFYRQRPIENYIVDFYAPTVKLVVEVDGSQHLTEPAAHADEERTMALLALGLNVLRFDNLEVLNQTEGVLNVIHNHLSNCQ